MSKIIISEINKEKVLEKKNEMFHFVPIFCFSNSEKVNIIPFETNVQITKIQSKKEKHAEYYHKNAKGPAIISIFDNKFSLY